jgi:hypothetical protein
MREFFAAHGAEANRSVNEVLNGFGGHYRRVITDQHPSSQGIGANLFNPFFGPQHACNRGCKPWSILQGINVPAISAGDSRTQYQMCGPSNLLSLNQLPEIDALRDCCGCDIFHPVVDRTVSPTARPTDISQAAHDSP